MTLATTRPRRFGLTGLVLALSLPLCALGAGQEFRDQIREAPGATYATERDSSEVALKLVDAFNTGGCDAVRGLVPADPTSRLNALGLALVAYCHPDSRQAEAWFRRAQAMDSTRDTVYMLHAHRLQQHDPEAAEPLWRKVALYARSGGMRMMAQDFLAGVGDASERPLLEADFGYYFSASLGLGYENNPLLKGAGTVSMNPSPYGTVAASAGLQRRLGPTTFAANYAMTLNSYWQDGSAQLWQNDLDLPISLRAGANEDLRLRPFGGYLSLGSAPYSIYGGLSIIGLTYRGRYRQTVQGAFFRDKYIFGSLKAQQGAHFRFDYNWEWYPPTGFLRLGAFIEHVQAGRDRDPQGDSIPYSHNDIGLTATTEYHLGIFLIGLKGIFTLREDDNDSTFASTSASTVQRRREDFQVSLQPTAAVPISANVDLLGSYRWLRRYSNMGADTFADRNLESHRVEVDIKFSWADL